GLVREVAQRWLLRRRGQLQQIFKAISLRLTQQTGNFEPPERGRNVRINGVFGDDIKAVIWRDGLHVRPDVPQPVVAERGKVIQPAQQPATTERRHYANSPDQ